MKKHATKLEKLFLERMIGEGLEKADNNSCCFFTNDYVIEISFNAFYNQKSMQFNTGSQIILYSPKLDELIKDFEGEDVFRFYYTQQKYKIYFIVVPMLWYLQLHHGKEKYPGNMYTYFDKSTVIDNPEVVVEYYYKELYQNVFLPIKEKYGTFALADKNINEEILETGKVKKDNIIWVDHDFHCMRSLLVAYINKNPNLPKLLEICNSEIGKSNPSIERQEIYNYIVNKIIG